jgi:hypothetical protein
MSTAPLLTIAIPTFDRAAFLKETLEMFSRELRQLAREDVEILVVDNASTDSTGAVCETLRGALPLLNYVRNTTNIGVEQNILRCSQTSRGMFTWIFGDDDRVETGAIATIVGLLDRHRHVDALLLNYKQWNRDLTQLLCPSVLGVEEDFEVPSIKDFLSVLGCGEVLAFIGSVIFRTERVAAVPYETYAGFGSCIGHVGALLDGLKGRVCYFVATPLVVQRQGNSRAGEPGGRSVNTLVHDMESFLALMRMIDYLIERGVMTSAEVDMLTAKTTLEPFPRAQCVSVLDWWTDAVLKAPLLANIESFQDRAYNELNQLLSRREFGSSNARIRNVLDLGLAALVATRMLRRS